MKKYVIGVLIGVCISALVVFGCGEWGGSQFSPESFQIRRVTSYYIPHTDVTVLTRMGEPHRPRIVQFWIDEGYLVEPTQQPKRWDLVAGERAWSRYKESGPAKYFWHQGKCYSDEGADEWIAWSRRHPAFATRLWPDVVKLLAKGKTNDYHLAGRLMALISKASDEQAFDAAYAAWWAERKADGE